MYVSLLFDNAEIVWTLVDLDSLDDLPPPHVWFSCQVLDTFPVHLVAILAMEWTFVAWPSGPPTAPKSVYDCFQ